MTENTAARLDRERSFHDDRFAAEHRSSTAKYYAVDSGGRRYADLVETEVRSGAAVLEYGCGTGSKAFGLARTGARVVGVDISHVGVVSATEVAALEEVDARFVQMDAEQLAFAGDTFDVVCGSGILHHLDLDRSTAELQRVLRPGGVAVFYEPLGTNPLINLYRRLTPSMRTPDEHPLVQADLRLMEQRFDEVSVEHHSFLSLAGAVLRRVPVLGGRMVRLLQVIDGALFRFVPWSRRLAWVVVIRLRR